MATRKHPLEHRCCVVGMYARSKHNNDEDGWENTMACPKAMYNMQALRIKNNTQPAHILHAYQQRFWLSLSLSLLLALDVIWRRWRSRWRWRQRSSDSSFCIFFLLFFLDGRIGKLKWCCGKLMINDKLCIRFICRWKVWKGWNAMVWWDRCNNVINWMTIK